ncbi:hypothetical protein EZV62_007819 [Acer yangbiense]|uniref:Uncharacterized protein n=1 Tax=Acer yangbiense TaxID=1000413 RepID=A0A5C7IBM3_9ROSI|nr:hypothetical protein EZV62_007819 [Acer yangbiense]
MISPNSRLLLCAASSCNLEFCNSACCVLILLASLVFRIMVSPSMLGLVEPPMVLEATWCSSSPTFVPVCVLEA